MNKEQKDALRGFTIIIKNLHIRYEDDYYSGENPYSFGAVIDVSHHYFEPGLHLPCKLVRTYDCFQQK